MNKFYVKLIISVILCIGFFTLTAPAELAMAQKVTPPYAKWGRIAMENVKQKYPNANIVDYLHVGRKKGPETSTETFKLWLEAPDKEFGVFVDITFNNETEKIVNITYREVSS